MRHPVFKALRKDKNPKEIKKQIPMEESIWKSCWENYDRFSQILEKLIFSSRLIFYFCPMSNLTKQELHNLAMNIVGEAMEKDGFEFLGINSELKKNPQFVGLRDKKLHFVIVRAIPYPENPEEFDRIFMESIKTHALKFDAKTYWAGVGLANAKDYDLPVSKDDDYVVNFRGLQEI